MKNTLTIMPAEEADKYYWKYSAPDVVDIYSPNFDSADEALAAAQAAYPAMQIDIASSVTITE